MKKKLVIVYHRKDLVEQLKFHIRIIQNCHRPYQHQSITEYARHMGDVARGFRIKYGIYECF